MKRSLIVLACLSALPLMAGISNRPKCNEEDLCKPSVCPAKKPGQKMARQNRGRQQQQQSKECGNPCDKPCVNPCAQKPQKKKKESVCGEPCVPFCPVEETLPRRQITPPIIPNVSCGWNIEISADFIWWDTYIDGMQYGISNVADGGPFVPFGTSVGRGTIANPNFKFEPGFKVGIGSSLGHDGWDIFANYTWLRNGNDLPSHLTGTPGAGAIGPFKIPTFPNSGGELAESAAASFSQSTNVLDVELGRAFFISRHLILRPFTGLKGAWIQNNLRCDYRFIPDPFSNAGDPTVFNVVGGSSKFVQSMGGVGIRSGLNTDWLIWRNLGIYANFACTLLWSDFHAREKDYTETTNLGITVNLNTLQTVRKVNPVLEAGLGISYVMWNCDNSYRFQFQLGWEEQVWFDFNQIRVANNNMSLHGLTGNFNFTF